MRDDLVTGPRSLAAMMTVILSVIDAVGIHAVMALNQAHSHLVKARVVAGPPPSDKWYRLLEQLELNLPDPDRVAASSYDNNAADMGQQVCELLVCAAAFFASESSDLEDQLALLSDTLEHNTIRARLTSIANQAGYTADALLKHAEDGAWQELLDLHDSPNVAEAFLGGRGAKNTAHRDVEIPAIVGSAQAQPKPQAGNAAVKHSSVEVGALPRLDGTAAVRGHIRHGTLLRAVASLVTVLSIGSVLLGLGMVHLGDGRGTATPVAESHPVDKVDTVVVAPSHNGDQARTHVLVVNGPVLVIPRPKTPSENVKAEGSSEANELLYDLYQCWILRPNNDASPRPETNLTQPADSTADGRPSHAGLSAQCTAIGAGGSQESGTK